MLRIATCALVVGFHHRLERVERRHRLLAAGDEEGELADRLQRAARRA